MLCQLDLTLLAVKRGDWVLLDELNLASQSVLEGLNSMLDHRGTVYVPEIGQSFACPMTFRIFGCQNPTAQGGGRKGLPQSFLNRFTKVYVEAFKEEDLIFITTAMYPSFPPGLVEKMVRFNCRMHRDSMVEGRFARVGSPWEFNLRDIFRWCDLLLRCSPSIVWGPRKETEPIPSDEEQVDLAAQPATTATALRTADRPWVTRPPRSLPAPLFPSLASYCLLRHRPLSVRGESRSAAEPADPTALRGGSSAGALL